MRTKLRPVVLATSMLLIGSSALLAGPAHAASSASGTNVVFSASAGCGSCRTLVLKNADGSTPISSLNMNSLSDGFIAEVQDSGINPAALGNFTVQATMSNLYGYSPATGKYNCAVSIPSSALSLSSSAGLLDANSLSAAVQPVFTIAGNLTGVLTGAITTALSLVGITPTTSVSITNFQGIASSTLSQLQQAGTSAPDLLGSTLLNKLPILLSSGPGGAFTNPDTAPPGSGCTGGGSGASQVPVMNGALNAASPLLTDLQTVLNGTPVSTLISQGLLDPSTLETAIVNATGIPAQYLDSTLSPFNGLLGSIENTLTGSVTSLVGTATTITGHYDSYPVLSINGSGVSPGSYQGQLTVTLFDPPPAG